MPLTTFSLALLLVATLCSAAVRSTASPALLTPALRGEGDVCRSTAPTHRLSRETSGQEAPQTHGFLCCLALRATRAAGYLAFPEEEETEGGCDGETTVRVQAPRALEVERCAEKLATGNNETS
ncbi:hypothetical protein T484DRAFT_3551930 [Baffinella frigidus]|nr:hypothetical protein T484DRAFT_3551930 [Cryptophyta sp. CCMP2293]